ncbi:TonB-dependent receptor [Maribacter sp. CXY002]|uniref:TonB-dependent receptor n=1 Tax=Maribacter luteocoastalis TaxID=3407671 RepID=UPI003B6828B6
MKNQQLTRLSCFLCVIFTLLSFSIQSQETIEGKVLDENNEPLLGASVLIKGTSNGTTTNFDGNFILNNVPSGSTIILSYVGYVRQELAAKDGMTVTMAVDANALREVIVTAENRNVSAQKVAITMDLVSGAKLQEMGVTDLSQLQNLAPSLGINQNTLFTQIFVRGVGGDVGAAELQDQAITLSIDGEFINRPVGLNASLFDLERIEVLKGPQGTLYGRNATAGAINILAAKPKLNLTEGNVSAQYGNYNSLKLNAAVNLPVGKIAAVRIAAMSDSHDGYRESNADPAQGYKGDFDNGKVWGARLGVLLKPSDKFTAYVAGEINKIDQQAVAQYGVPVDSTGQPPFEFETDLPENFDIPTPGFIKTDQAAIRGRLSYDFGSTVLTYTGGYRNIDLDNYQPLNGFVPEIFSFSNDLKYDTQSHELRLNGESTSFIWQTGLFYGDEDQTSKRGLFLPAASGAFGGQVPFLNFFGLDVNSKTTGLFGQATINLNDFWSFTGGLRYTNDNKSLAGYNLQTAPFGPPGTPAYFFPDSPPSDGDPGTGEAPGAGEGSWSQITWMANLEYKPSDNTMWFAKASTGYKSGGFNVLEEYDAENLLAFEVGSKNYLANRTLRLNGSAFVYKYTDQQVNVFFNTAVGGLTQNAGESDYFGLELDGDWLATPKDRFNFTINYLNAEFKDLPTLANVSGGSPSVEVNLAGNVPPQAPKWTLIGGYNHTFELGKGTLDAGINSMFKSEYYLQVFNYNMDRQESYSKTDVNIKYTSANKKWELGAFVNNLEDNRILTYASFIGGGIDLYNFAFGAPRLIGVRTSFNF